jgi:hypothetical protein
LNFPLVPHRFPEKFSWSRTGMAIARCPATFKRRDL